MFFAVVTAVNDDVGAFAIRMSGNEIAVLDLKGTAVVQVQYKRLIKMFVCEDLFGGGHFEFGLPISIKGPKAATSCDCEPIMNALNSVFVDRAPLPHYEFAIEFYTTFLGLRHETGARYFALGVLSPDAEVGENHRPLFKVDAESIERHRAEIRAYKARRVAARQNVKNLTHV